MAQVPRGILLSAILLLMQAVLLSASFPESCVKQEGEGEISLAGSPRGPLLDFYYLMQYEGEPDGVLMMQAFTKFLYDTVQDLNSDYNDWNRVEGNLRRLEDGVRAICRNYDDDYTTNAFPYSCYSKVHWCSLKELMSEVLGKIQLTRAGENNWLKPWTGSFNPPDNDWGDTLMNEVKMVSGSFFYHSSLGSMTQTVKGDHTDLKKKIVDRVYYYALTNNLDNLKIFINMFDWVKEDFETACSNDGSEFVCMMQRIFDNVEAMLQDTDTFQWDFHLSPPRTREVIAMLWLVIPSDVKELFPSIAEERNARERVQRFLQILFDNVVSKNTDELQSLMSHSENLQNQCHDECLTNSNPDGLECVFSNVSKHINDLVTDVKASGNWLQRKTLDMRSGVLIGLMGTRTRDFIEFTTTQIREFVIDAFERIYFYVKRNDIEGLDQYTKSMPATNSLLHSPGRSCSEFLVDLKLRIPCLFKNMLREIFLYMNSQKRAPLNTKIISTDHDYKDLLKSAQLASISSQISQQTIEVKANLIEFVNEMKTFVSQETGRRFAALESYFQGIADFDGKKATADIGFIATRLEAFDTQLAEVQPDLEERLYSVINGSVLASQVDTVQRAGELIIKSAFACNPLDPDPGAVIDAANDLAQSIVNVMRSDALKRLFGDVVTQTVSVASGMSKNNDFIKTVRKIVDDLPNQLDNSEEFTAKTTDFLDKYGEYNPQVQRQEISEMGANWEAFLAEGCETMYEGGTVASGVVESIFAHKADCLTTGAVISKLVEIFSEIYEYQFDLMETLATAVRAYQSKHFSQRLNTNLRVIGEQDLTEESDNEAVNLNEAMLNFFLIYRMHTFQIVAQYCNYLEFQNAGEMPSVCPDALATLEQNDISKVISFTPAGCTPESFKFVDIPTTDSNDADQDGFINMTRLYKGDEVPFQVPDIDWMLRHRWITSADARDTAIYVTAFELFLPADEQSSRRRTIQSNAKKVASTLPRVITKRSLLAKVKHAEGGSSGPSMLKSPVDVKKAVTKSGSTTPQRDIRFQITAQYSAPLFFAEESDRYVLQPRRRYVFSYQENADSCRQDTIDNPYSKDLPQICPVTLKPVNNDVNPSVFSLWKVKLQSPSFETVPAAAATDANVKAAIRLCKVTKPSTVSKKKKKNKMQA